MSPRYGGRRLIGLLLAALVPLGAGCVEVPHGGPVVTAGAEPGVVADDGPLFDPRPPEPGEQPAEIVRHFLEAMQANPISTLVAREFLTEDARANWSPDRGVLTYADVEPIAGFSKVRATLVGVHRLDQQGNWLGPEEDQTLTFTMLPEGGEWRIDRVPENALIVPDWWFQQRYQAVSVYFFDPTARILVPEPVFVPRGQQLPTSLMRALLLGPPEPAAARSFIPTGTSLDLSVVVTDGMAEVPLRGDLAALPEETVQLMATQIAWTLRQDPSISLVTVTVDGEPLALPENQTEFGVSLGAGYEPVGALSHPEMFGLREGRVVKVTDDGEQPVTGPFGSRTWRLRDISVDLFARRIAGVTADGHTVYATDLDESGSGAVVPLLTGANDVLHPAWDVTGRLWLLDRRRGGAELISVDAKRRRRTIEVPGITGERVIDFLVSRDGTRIVAAVASPGGSHTIVAARLISDEAGRPLRGTPARTVVQGQQERLRIRDLGWRSPTSFVYLTALTSELSEIRSAPVDGSPAPLAQAEVSEVVVGRASRVISSPRVDQPILVVDRSGAITPFPSTAETQPAGLTVLTYVG